MEANLSRYLAAIINAFNYDMSTANFNNTDKIQQLLLRHNSMLE